MTKPKKAPAPELPPGLGVELMLLRYRAERIRLDLLNVTSGLDALVESTKKMLEKLAQKP